MKRIGIFSTVILGTILMTYAAVSAQEPPKPGPGAPGCAVFECEIQRAVQEAYERGFKQGFREGFNAQKEMRHDESPYRRGPQGGPQIDFRGPGPKREHSERDEFRRGTPPRFHDRQADFHGPGFKGDRNEFRHNGPRHIHRFSSDLRGPDSRGVHSENGEFRSGAFRGRPGPQGDFRGFGPRGERPERGEFRHDGPPHHGPKGEGPGSSEMVPPPGE